MSQCIGLLAMILALSVCAEADGIATAAASPYRLAKFVETHRNFDWAPLHRALHINDASVFLPRCEGTFEGVPPCSSELIMVADPRQAIVLIEHESSNFQACFRYWSNGNGGWRFGGAYAPFVKYFRPEHRIIRFGARPFLIVTGQGYAGTGLSSKVEAWIDLTEREFRPALAFTAEGHSAVRPGGIWRETRGHVEWLETKPVESVTVAYSVDFESGSLDGNRPLGKRQDEVVYVRKGTGKFEIDQSHSTATKVEVEKFYEDLGSEISDAEMRSFLRHRSGAAGPGLGLLNQPGR